MKIRFAFLIPRLALLLLIVLLSAGCNTLTHDLTNPMTDRAQYKAVFIEEPTVASEEQTPEVLSDNKEVKAFLTNQLNMEYSKSWGLETLSQKDTLQGHLIARSDLYLVYGSRAARYWGGFGAGAGLVKLELSLIDAATGQVAAKQVTESELKMGSFGGSMKAHAKGVIRQALKKFFRQPGARR